jgi:hypothetical protein
MQHQDILIMSLIEILISYMKKVIVWTKGIDDLIHDKGRVGGITVQLYYWAKTLYCNGST